MKYLTTSFFIFFSLMLVGQTNYGKFDVRIGVGIHSTINTNAIHLLNNELNYKVNEHITVAGAIAIANLGSEYNNESYNQLNLNAFVSPLGNNRTHDFRIGGGLSFMNSNRTLVIGLLNSANITGDFIPENSRLITDRNQLKQIGYNSIVEYTYHINQRFLIGSLIQFQNFEDLWYRRNIILKVGISL